VNVYSPSQLKQLSTLVEALPPGDDEANECVVFCSDAKRASKAMAAFEGRPHAVRVGRKPRTFAWTVALHH